MSLIERPSSLLDDFYRPFGGFFSQNLPRIAESAAWQPSVDIKREDGAYLIEVEVPGLSPDKVEVEAHDNVLTIQGSREKESEQEEGNYLRRERHYGKFVRRFSLPNGTATEQISAQVKDGMLNVRVPDGQATKPTRVSIT